MKKTTQQQDEELLKRFETAGVDILIGSRRNLLSVANAISRVAEILATDFDNAQRDFAFQSVSLICQANRPVLAVLKRTTDTLNASLDAFIGIANARRDRNIQGLNRADSKSRMKTASNLKTAKILFDFGNVLAIDSNSFRGTYEKFKIETGANPNKLSRLGTPALDLVLFYFELAVHEHLGPIGTLLHLLEVRKEANERLEHPLLPTLTLLFALDSLIEAMTLVAISLGQMPVQIDKHGLAITVTKEAAKASFLKAVEIEGKITA